MKHLSIRWRLTVWYAAALTLILISFCVCLLLLTRKQLLSRTDGALREELQELELEIRLANNDVEFQENLKARFHRHDIFDFLVTDLNKSVLFASVGLTPAQVSILVPNDAPVNPYFASQDLGNQVACRIARLAMNRPAGRVVIQVITPLKPLYDDMQTLQLLMITLLPLEVVAALLVGQFLAARALAPVKQIVEVAESITISGLDRRIEVINSHDELGHLAITLNMLIARLECAVDEIQRFTADASHELRTPLAILRSEAESSLMKQRSPEEYEQTLSIVVDEAKRLGALADQLLVLSRQDAGITTCRREFVSVDAVLLDVVEKLRPLAESRSVSLNATFVESCELLGDDVRLSQAFFNVLENAIKYTKSEGIVEVSCRVSNDSALVVISDTGIGIPPEHIDRVFDRFYRVDPSRNCLTGGAGLGLSIARSAIGAHQGEIKLKSAPGLGTTVAIRLAGVSTKSENNNQESSFIEGDCPAASIGN